MAGIYIHIPFCVSKCLYCDFVSFPDAEPQFEAYKNALLKEIESCEEIKNKKIETIFLGGGTPTVFNVYYIEEIVNRLSKFKIDKNCEISIESNPGTIDFNKLKSLRQMGFNRLSLGVQSLNDNLLQKIGRIHTAQTFKNNYRDARKAGFENINLDLMFALPGQTLEDFEQTLNEAVKLDPKHISAYSLIIEKNTPFYEMFEKGEIREAEHETDRYMYELLKNTLCKNGYDHYEISNFAKKGYECRHNLCYWQRGDYFGFGLNSHSFVGGYRFCNTSVLDKYLSGDNIKEQVEFINQKQAMEEFMFLGLRLIKGVYIENFYKNFNKTVYAVYGSVINKYIKTGFMEDVNGWLRLTDKGIDVLNIILSEFIINQ